MSREGIGQGTRIIRNIVWIEEMRKYYLVTTDHLETALWFREDGDFVVGMNHVAVQAALRPEVLVLAFILMSNHVHFVLYATEKEARAFVEAIKSRYSQYLFRKYGIRELLRRNHVDVRLIDADNDAEALERAIAYVQMNCVEARICAHPSQYRWGTGNVFFCPKSGSISGKPIGSPAVDHPDVLVCMNQPSYERYIGDVVPGGVAIVDSTVPLEVAPPEGVTVHRMPAIDLSLQLGVPKAANTMMLAALMKLGVTGLQREHLLNALYASFKKKPELVEKNRVLVQEAEKWIEENLLK